MSADCSQGKVNASNIGHLTDRVKGLEDAVLEIRENLLQRPSWAVSITITVLTGLCVGLIMKIVS